MDSAARKKLEQVALERLNATADDVEQWSFLFRTEGSQDFLYCSWSVTEDWEFDGDIEDLDLPWAPDRLRLIASGEGEPNEEELAQWRRAMCRKLIGSDWTSVAWIVPLRISQTTAGYALFLVSIADPVEAPPVLAGVFDHFEEARAALALEGVVEAPPRPETPDLGATPE